MTNVLKHRLICDSCCLYFSDHSYRLNGTLEPISKWIMA